MKEAFIHKRFSPERLRTIATVNAILAEYQADGYDLSLRQLYYQMVARGYIENSQRSYKRLGDLVNDARLAGLTDWAMITDRGRELVHMPHWRSPGEIVAAAADQFRIDKWAEQAIHVEVMVEKAALEGVLIPVCQALDIGFTANKGYSSASTLYEAGKRLARAALYGRQPWIIYLGDHDPSGIDMTRDVEKRLTLFAGCPVRVQRLALNFDQVRALRPPENPAKETDARYAAYAARFGQSCWELDAIEPRALADLVTGAVRALRDEALWEAAVAEEATLQAQLRAVAAQFDVS